MSCHNNISIQIDGRPFSGEAVTIECLKVVIIPGKLVNIVTTPHDPNNFVRLIDEDGEKRIEGAGKLYELLKSNQ